MIRKNTKIFILTFSTLIMGLNNHIPAQDSRILKIKEGLQSEKIMYRLTEPEEIMEILGSPQNRVERKDGGMVGLDLHYPDLVLSFWKMRDDPVPFTLWEIKYKGENLDIGRSKKLKLRTNDDLKKIDRFWGFSNISLARLDLRDEDKIINAMSFDSRTEWPEAEKLPEGFDPEKLISNAKSPGLGVGELHKEGIDGTGIGLAIIDQPLLLGHEEYTHRIVRYDATGLSHMPPQMHASPVTSIAVGKNLGVAPGATLTYFAVPMWEPSNLPYIRSLERIMELNKNLPETERIRVVSISTGMFKHYEHYEEWVKTLNQAEDQGILIVTCDPDFLHYGILSLSPGQDPDDVRSYSPGIYSSEKNVIRVPGSNKTIASHMGNDVYTFDRGGGISWGAPYIAGLAALAFQVNPDLKPAEILEILIRTATPCETVPIVNPQAFIEAARK